VNIGFENIGGMFIEKKIAWVLIILFSIFSFLFPLLIGQNGARWRWLFPSFHFGQKK
jgi:hypothetical protein